MNQYWQQQHGLTPDEKQAFVERVKAENAAFLGNLRTIHSAAENRMLTRVARELVNKDSTEKTLNFSLPQV